MNAFEPHPNERYASEPLPITEMALGVAGGIILLSLIFWNLAG